MDTALAPHLLTDDELNAIGERVDVFYKHLGLRTSDTPLSYEDDERVLGEISALLDEMYRLDRRHRLAGGSFTDSIHVRLRNSANRLYPIENLFAYSQALHVAADVETMLFAYADHIVERDRALNMNEPVPAFTHQDEALSDRLFCKYILEAAPSMQGYTPRLYGTAAVARIVAIIDELTEGRYVAAGRGVLRIENARRIAQYTEKIHAYYTERFKIGPMNIARTPRTGAARVLFASWQDIVQINTLFPKDAIIARALQNTAMGDEIVTHHAEFVQALDYCAEDMRKVMSTACLVAQQTAYMRLNQEQRETCAEIVDELRSLANDVRDMVHSRDGQIFYHGALKKKYDQLLVVDLKIAIERYSCESV